MTSNTHVRDDNKRSNPAKALDVLAGADAELPLESTPQVDRIAKPAIRGNPLDGTVAVFQASLGRLQPLLLYVTGRARPHLFTEYAREVARAHGRAPRQPLHTQVVLQVLQNPGLQGADGAVCVGLARERRAKLRLPARTTKIKDQGLRHLLRDR